MYSKATFAVLAIALVAAPLSAQIRPRTDGRRTSDGSVIRTDGSVVRPDGTIIRPDGSVIRTSDGNVSRSSRSSKRIPPGQLPPRGMCRVWIDGVPPGQQPPVEDCASARARAATTANARVIYGDEQSFPGRGKNRRSQAQSCVSRDVVVVNGRQVPVCRDANGNIIWDGSNRTANRRHDNDDEDDDDDRFEDRGDDRRGRWEDRDDDRGNREWKSERKRQKQSMKAARKREKGNRGRDGRDN